MNARTVVSVVSTLLLLALIVKQAQADWLVAPVTPRALSVDGRTFQVAVREVRGAKECTVTIRIAPTAQPVRPSAHATLRLTPVKGGVREASPSREVVKETRTKDRLTYTFRVTPEQLPRLTFEFWDAEVLGGTLFEIHLQDFVPAPS